jgi:hypothetical protein
MQAGHRTGSSWSGATGGGVDRGAEAREVLATDDTHTTDRFGKRKAHPAVAVERDSRIGFARLIRELDLDGEPGPDPRPPQRA